ncbi:MAG: guanylate kinase [Acidimicrobiales bacterium]
MPLIFVVSGPGGVGKGTLVDRLVDKVPHLWLSRSWTTRPRRDGEAEGAYVFVDAETFRARVEAGGFLEWARFLGHLYGTPIPDAPAGDDVLLEIDVQGARQVLAACPGAVAILVVAPTAEDQAVRLRARGDDEAHVESRLALGRDEEREARALASHVVVNDELERAVSELAGIVEAYRSP